MAVPQPGNGIGPRRTVERRRKHRTARRHKRDVRLRQHPPARPRQSRRTPRCAVVRTAPPPATAAATPAAQGCRRAAAQPATAAAAGAVHRVSPATAAAPPRHRRTRRQTPLRHRGHATGRRATAASLPVLAAALCVPGSAASGFHRRRKASRHRCLADAKAPALAPAPPIRGIGGSSASRSFKSR